LTRFYDGEEQKLHFASELFVNCSESDVTTFRLINADDHFSQDIEKVDWANDREGRFNNRHPHVNLPTMREIFGLESRQRTS
jgi:hypothetical protein